MQVSAAASLKTCVIIFIFSVLYMDTSETFYPRLTLCMWLVVVIMAGKSSLMNALARRPAAIVSPIAGTTR